MSLPGLFVPVPAVSFMHASGLVDSPSVAVPRANDDVGPYSRPASGGRSLGGMHAIAILAHQGGWDEILMVAGPIVVFAGLLAVARRRALRHSAAAEPIDD
jgi:hypothetical protein